MPEESLAVEYANETTLFVAGVLVEAREIIAILVEMMADTDEFTAARDMAAGWLRTHDWKEVPVE